MVGRQAGEEQLAVVAYEFGLNFGRQHVVEPAQRRDPGRERQISPVNQMGREAYEFPSRSFAEEGRETS